MSPLRAIGWLTFPLWSLVLVLAALSQFRFATNAPGEPFIVFGFLTPFLGAIPIYNLKANPVFKTLVFGAYYIACAVTEFMAGWAALGVFGMAT